ncbi:MAG: hypothetical protein RL571_3143 [Pseudomonadota bacterium]|jgi:hypothetical protein
MKYTALFLLLFLSACGSSAVDDASDIIKTTLKKPKSFVLTDGNVIWQSTLADKALIVKVNYTAQNGLNQVIKECKYVSFYQQDGQNKWQENGGIENCIAAGGKEELQALEILKRINAFK